MKRGLLFSRLVGLTLLRDPLSYVFCVGTPTGMLLLFYIIYACVPAEGRANVLIFRPDILTPGICFFGFTFVMLLAALLVARDRTTAFLDRLSATPLRTADFLVGYLIPLFILGVAQCVLTLGVGAILGATVEAPLSFVGCIRAVAALMPVLIFFIGLGIGFGSLLSANAAPGATSFLITLSGMMGGVWMPLSTMPKLERAFSFFPFVHMVRLGQNAMAGVTTDVWLHLGVSLAYTALAVAFPLWAFSHSLQKNR